MRNIAKEFAGRGADCGLPAGLPGLWFKAGVGMGWLFSQYESDAPNLIQGG